MWPDNEHITGLIMSEIYQRVKDANINIDDLYNYLKKQEELDLKKEMEDSITRKYTLSRTQIGGNENE